MTPDFLSTNTRPAPLSLFLATNPSISRATVENSGLLAADDDEAPLCLPEHAAAVMIIAAAMPVATNRRGHERVEVWTWLFEDVFTRPNLTSADSIDRGVHA